MIIKSRAINSIALAGFKKIFAYKIFLSTKSGVVVVSSKITLKSVKPKPAWTPSRNGMTCPLNLSQVAETFCSNNVLEAILEISFLTKIRSLLTLILSSAEGVTYKVFCPKITIPSAGKDAIGLMLTSYNLSLSSAVNL